MAASLRYNPALEKDFLRSGMWHGGGTGRLYKPARLPAQKCRMSTPFILALDQGTTSSRAVAFGLEGTILAQAQQEFAQIYPNPGWVEHDPEVIWATTLSTARAVLREMGERGATPIALGIANQRETTMIWDRATGAPIHNAIVWQDRRTAPVTQRLAEAGHGPMVQAKTGLVLDPYFSATKIAAILDAVPGARERAERGELCFGTVDSFLVFRLTQGAVHATDATNASRTSLYDIGAGRWDADLCALFNVPMALLPQVRDCAGSYGATAQDLLGQVLPITGIAGDQQAALIGQAGLTAGDVKSTYGTGAFLVLNTGDRLIKSRAKLLGTIAYQLAGKTTYALEGSVLSAGSTVQWLRDGLGLFTQAAEVEALARQGSDDSGVYLVPAFTGLGAPHWDPDARGALTGLTRGSGRADIARAALDATAFQTADLLAAMAEDGVAPRQLRVDGGMANNAWFVQRLADILAIPVVRPQVTETTALGAALLAGLGCGAFASLSDAASMWRADLTATPQMPEQARTALLTGWRAAVQRVLTAHP